MSDQFSIEQPPYSHSQYARQVGHLEGRLEALERKVESFERHLEGRLSAIETKIDQLHTLLHLGRGGVRALTLLAAIISFLAGGITWLMQHLMIKPPL